MMTDLVTEEDLDVFLSQATETKAAVENALSVIRRHLPEADRNVLAARLAALPVFVASASELAAAAVERSRRDDMDVMLERILSGSR